MKQLLAGQEVLHPRLFPSLQTALRPLMALSRAQDSTRRLVEALLRRGHGQPGDDDDDDDGNVMEGEGNVVGDKDGGEGEDSGVVSKSDKDGGGDGGVVGENDEGQGQKDEDSVVDTKDSGVSAGDGAGNKLTGILKKQGNRDEMKWDSGCTQQGNTNQGDIVTSQQLEDIVSEAMEYAGDDEVVVDTGAVMTGVKLAEEKGALEKAEEVAMKLAHYEDKKEKEGQEIMEESMDE
jgi:hypothetical protein